jgi:hypothetical protein
VSNIKGGKHRLRAFENRAQSKIFGLKKDEVTGCWRKLHNEELRDLYSSPGVIRTTKIMWIRWTRNIARMDEKMNACRLLVGKSERKSQ